MARDENMIAALKRERAVYESRGDTDRVKQVDEQLRHYQGDDEAPDSGEPEGRTGPESAQRTADSSSGRGAKKTAAKKTAASKPPTEPETEKPATPAAD
jgi:hypothetical protein